MRELIDEYGGMVCVFLLGFAFIGGLKLIFDAIVSGAWVV